ncbi:MAG: hypothetical protein Q3966_08220 [Neisseria sp.]|nr:hypothetical protein [Neisseria sp.]
MSNMFNKMLRTLKEEWVTAFEPKGVVLNGYSDVKRHAKSLQHLDEDDLELLMEYVTQAEISRKTGHDTGARYGVTVEEAINHQKMLQEINSTLTVL